MIDFAYEDLETEAVQEREENEKYEAECTAEESLEPTRTKAHMVKEYAEADLRCLKTIPGARQLDIEFCRLIIRLAEAIDER